MQLNNWRVNWIMIPALVALYRFLVFRFDVENLEWDASFGNGYARPFTASTLTGRVSLPALHILNALSSRM
jgi:hypothetical protein